jgi:arginyl-tRNA synthetase
MAGKSPEQTGQLIGDYLQAHVSVVNRFNVVKGFLNLVIGDKFWIEQFSDLAPREEFGFKKIDSKSPLVVVEYSSPNTNKPLHLGHVRNNLLGYSISEIVKANGSKVRKVNLVNDRGIHICKSMLAWKKYGNGETPETSKLKGDHLVGRYYVEFDKRNKIETQAILGNSESPEYAQLSPANQQKLIELEKKVKELGAQQKDASRFVDERNELAKNNTPLMQEAQQMLRNWEAGDAETIALWKMMNSWVYDGFGKTYAKLGVDFDEYYYESNTYLLGKSIIEKGLTEKVLQKRADGAVIIDLREDGLDEKVLLRSDGTSVYMTQDLGTAVQRYEKLHFDKHIYVVGNEQEYHFKALKLALKKLGNGWAEGLYHLSYGMVELPEGKMKSREGTVVDADDLIDAMEQDARQLAEERGLITDMDETEKSNLYHNVGMAALKYFILKVDPSKKMLFNPAESIDLQGHTGPFIQYTHARIRSMLRKAGYDKSIEVPVILCLHEKEKELIKHLCAFPDQIAEAAANYSPAIIAQYVYDLAKLYNQFYDNCPVLKEEESTRRQFRIQLSHVVSRTIQKAMGLLGIQVPERM